MSGENKKPKKGSLLLAVAPWLLAVVLGVGVECLGIWLGHSLTWGEIPYACFALLMFLVPLLSKLYAFLYTRGKNQLNVTQMNDLLDTEKLPSNPMWRWPGKSSAAAASWQDAGGLGMPSCLWQPAFSQEPPGLTRAIPLGQWFWLSSISKLTSSSY